MPLPNVPAPNLAAPQLNADTQRFIAQNLAPNTQAGTLAPNNPFWATLKQKVINRQYQAQPMLGGGFGQVDFADAYPDGGVLIGFFVGDDGQGHVGFLQPIYLTAAGEKSGLAYGAVRQTLQCLKAKSGYAVGGLNLRTGGVIDALAVIFAKVEGEQLSRTDRYSSVLVGGQGGGPTTGSATEFVVGIYGKRLEREAFAPAGAITGIGLLTAP